MTEARSIYGQHWAFPPTRQRPSLDEFHKPDILGIGNNLANLQPEIRTINLALMAGKMRSIRITSKSPIHILVGSLYAVLTACTYQLHLSLIDKTINLIDSTYIYPLTGTLLTLYIGIILITWIHAYYQQSRWIAFIALKGMRAKIRRGCEIIFGFGATCALIGTIEKDPKAASLGSLCLIVIGIFLYFLEFSIFLMQDKALKQKQYAYQWILITLIAIPAADIGYIAAKGILSA